MEKKIEVCDPRLVQGWKATVPLFGNASKQLNFNKVVASRMAKFKLPERSLTVADIAAVTIGVKPILTSTLRSSKEQAALYMQGRFELGLVNKARKEVGLYPLSSKENVTVTWTKVSKHNPNKLGLSQAFDVAFVKNNKLIWDKLVFGVFACLISEVQPSIVWGAEIVKKDGKFLLDFPHFEVS